VRLVIPFKPDHVPEGFIPDFRVEDLFDLPLGCIARDVRQDRSRFVIARAAFEGVIFHELQLHDREHRVESGETGWQFQFVRALADDLGDFKRA
jgi:hypothetical protein